MKVFLPVLAILGFSVSGSFGNSSASSVEYPTSNGLCDPDTAIQADMPAGVSNDYCHSGTHSRPVSLTSNPKQQCKINVQRNANGFAYSWGIATTSPAGQCNGSGANSQCLDREDGAISNYKAMFGDAAGPCFAYNSSPVRTVPFHN